MAELDHESVILKTKLLGSPLFFTQTFFKLRTGRDFTLSKPEGRESHFLTIFRHIKMMVDRKLEKKNLMILLPPRYAKTESVIHAIAYAHARYPDANSIYTSYSHSLAKKQTQTIRQIMQLPAYRKFFDVDIAEGTSAKDNFETTSGGSIYAAGAGGTITGRGAGIKGCDRFGGVFAMDDMHKPDEALSDTIREGVIDWFFNTAQSRINDRMTPFLFIGQRVHEADLAARLLKTRDWTVISLPALDDDNVPLYPEMHTFEELIKMREESPYIFSAQYQQQPSPSGGGIFKPEWFPVLEEEPKILSTFITADTAETDKTYNDATVFSFWGIYEIEILGQKIGTFGLHWLDCAELRVEPKDLESEFMTFYGQCLRHPVKPTVAAIEKKSTGVTLISTLKGMPGLRIIEVEHSGASGSKTSRFLDCQPIVASKSISFTAGRKHVQVCLDHMKKITANNTHRFDDIADSLEIAIKLSLIDKTLTAHLLSGSLKSEKSKFLTDDFRYTQKVRSGFYGSR